MDIKPYTLHFFNKKTGKFQQNIWNELNNGLWENFNIENYLLNSKIPANQPHKANNLFDDYIVVNSGTYYDTQTKELKEDLYYPTFVETDKKHLYKVFEEYFSQFSDKKIAVHLSGGLDSSILIALLHHFNIPFYLVGFTCHRFEFRTEKKIQEILAPLGQETVLIDLDDYPSFTNLSKKDVSQIPDANIKQVDASREIAKNCSKLGADIVFTGQGGDTVFVDEMNKGYACNIGSEFIFLYETEVLYPNLDLKLVSPYADKQIIDVLYSLRFGQKEDCLKKWTRHFFRDILPRELVEYTYCADFFGISMSGLEKAKPEIEELFRTAFEITRNKIFSPQATKDFLAIDVFDFEYQNYIDFCDKVSLATWYNSLLREGYVK